MGLAFFHFALWAGPGEAFCVHCILCVCVLMVRCGSGIHRIPYRPTHGKVSFTNVSGKAVDDARRWCWVVGGWTGLDLRAAAAECCVLCHLWRSAPRGTPDQSGACTRECGAVCLPRKEKRHSLVRVLTHCGSGELPWALRATAIHTVVYRDSMAWHANRHMLPNCYVPHACIWLARRCVLFNRCALVVIV